MRLTLKSSPSPKCQSCRRRDQPLVITCHVCDKPMSRTYHLNVLALPQGEAAHKECRPTPTHCPHGHEWNEENSHIKNGVRRCRACEREYARSYVVDGRRPKVRGHRSWRKLRDLYRSECAAKKLPCWICHERIDYTLQWPDGLAFEADHIMGVKSHPDLALERSNLAPSHSTCNRKRGATPVDPVDQRVEVFLLAQLKAAREEIAELRTLRGE